MQKKSIILLITLSFITVISILILKNLSDSNKFIKEVSLDSSLMQMNILDKNIKDEVIKLTYKHKDDIKDGTGEEFVLPITLPFEFENISTTITLEEFFLSETDCYLKEINTTEILNEKCEEDTVNGILYPYEFMLLLKDLKPNDKAQLEYFLDKYKQKTGDDKIDSVKDRFSYIKYDDNITYLQCSYTAEISDINFSASFIYNLDSKKIIFSEFID